MKRNLTDFNSFVGKPRLVARLRQQLEGAQRLGEVFPHTLLAGPSGLGKTHLAEALATESRTNAHLRHGNDTIEELAGALLRAKLGDFVVIDEAHGLTGKAQEIVMYAIDNRKLPDWVPVPEDDSASSGEGSRELCDLSYILATDQPGQLRNALVKRMELVERMDYYSAVEMRTIVDRLATELNQLISPQASNELARICGGIPRIARHHLKNLRRHFSADNSERLSIECIRRYLADFGFDELGLGPSHRKYLEYVRDTDGAALETLALRMNLDTSYVRREVEGQLLREGLIKLTSRGRQLTSRGRQHLNKNQKSQ